MSKAEKVISNLHFICIGQFSMISIMIWLWFYKTIVRTLDREFIIGYKFVEFSSVKFKIFEHSESSYSDRIPWLQKIIYLRF